MYNIKYSLRVFEIGVVRKVFGPKNEEVTGELRQLHNEKLHDLFSPNIIRVIKSVRRTRWAGHVACMGRKRNVCRVLVGKPEGRRLLRRTTCTWEDNSKTDLQEIGFDSVDCIHLAQDMDTGWTLLNTALNIPVA
jgi:hypothetical protein